MKEIVIISGKGGTGKTSIISAFASLARNKALCDADVDAADLHLIMAPEIKERHDFKSGNTAKIDQDLCTQCGLCRDLCRWNAISEDFVVNEIECEGCGVCHPRGRRGTGYGKRPGGTGSRPERWWQSRRRSRRKLRLSRLR